MTVVVAASDAEKNFGEWHNKAHSEPVEITDQGRTSAFLISAELYREMLASYRRVPTAAEVTDAEMALILSSKVETDAPYRLDDIDDEAPGASPAPGRR